MTLRPKQVNDTDFHKKPIFLLIILNMFNKYLKGARKTDIYYDLFKYYHYLMHVIEKIL